MDIEAMKRHVLVFIGSALDDGWTVRKKGDSYVFSKPHEGKKQVLTNEYLAVFLEKHMSLAAAGSFSLY